MTPCEGVASMAGDVRLLTLTVGVAEAARLLGLSVPTVRRLIRLKRLAVVRPEGTRRVMVPRMELDAFVARYTVGVEK